MICLQVAEVTFNLWYRLSEEVFKYNDDLLNAIFQPYVERLLTSLCRHLQMEPDHVSFRFGSFAYFFFSSIS